MKAKYCPELLIFLQSQSYIWEGSWKLHYKQILFTSAIAYETTQEFLQKMKVAI